MAGPAWGQGLRVFAWSHDGAALFFLRNERGFLSLWRYELASGAETRLTQLADYSSLGQLSASAQDNSIALMASAAQIPSRILTLDAGGRDCKCGDARPPRIPAGSSWRRCRP